MRTPWSIYKSKSLLLSTIIALSLGLLPAILGAAEDISDKTDVIDTSCQKAKVGNLSTDPVVNVRQGPGLSFSKVSANKGVLPDGHIVLVRGIIEGEEVVDTSLKEKSRIWVLVQSPEYKDSKGALMEGYVSGLYLRCTEKKASTKYAACLDATMESGEVVEALKSITLQQDCNAAFSSAKMLEELDLSNRNISDLRPLTHLKQLKRLNLAGNPLSSLNSLRSLSLLQFLDISGCELVNWESLGALRDLRELRAGDYTFPDGSFRLNYFTDIFALASLSQLQILDLGYNDILDLTGIENLTNLSSLVLEHNYRLSRIEPLRSLHNLQELNLSYAISVGSLETLKFLSSLRQIRLDGVTIEDTHVLANLSGLQELYLESAIINNSMLFFLPPSLRVLDLSWTEVNFLGALNRLKNLEVLKLQGLDEGTLANLPILTRLRGLDLAFTNLSSPQILKRISGCSRLQKLNLRGNNYTSFSELKNLNNLTDLNIESNSMSSVSSLVGGFRAIQNVWLFGNPLESDFCPFSDASVCHFEQSESGICTDITCSGAWLQSWQELLQ